MTLSRLISLRETFSILMLATSVLLGASKHAEKLVSCLRDSGRVELIPKLYSQLQGPPVLPLWQCRTTNGNYGWLGHVWDVLPSYTNVVTT